MSDYEFGVGYHRMKDGRDAYIACILPHPAGSEFTHIGWLESGDGKHYLSAWTSDGKCGTSPCGRDLAPPAKHHWRNEYDNCWAPGDWRTSIEECRQTRAPADFMFVLHRITQGDNVRYEIVHEEKDE